MSRVALSLKDEAVAAAISGAAVPFPDAGAMRVHKTPWDVYRPSSHSDGASQERGPNRFDDPHHHYPVRYLGEHLRVCLLEVMARFRANADAEALLAQMTPGSEDPELDDLVDPAQVQGVTDFLAMNQVAIFRPPPSAPLTTSVDVFDPDLLTALDGHHRIRKQLRQPAVLAAYGDAQGDVHLDGSLIRNASTKVGRPVTQEISWLLFNVLHVQALRYFSRHSEGDEAVCWAVRGDVPLDVKSAEYLDAANPHHRDAVQYVSDRYDLPLPLPWAEVIPT
jgi:hypothetical protein